MLQTVQTRGGAVIKARKLSSAMSAAKAIGDHLRDWHFGRSDGWTSMGVVTDGKHYGIPEQLVYSMPCNISQVRDDLDPGVHEPTQYFFSSARFFYSYLLRLKIGPGLVYLQLW